MNETSSWLAHDHSKYDVALAECEIAAEAGEWKNATRLFDEFVDDLKVHMRWKMKYSFLFMLRKLVIRKGGNNRFI